MIEAALNLDWLAVDASATADRLSAVLGRPIVAGERIELSGGSLKVVGSAGSREDRLDGLRIGTGGPPGPLVPPGSVAPSRPAAPVLLAVGWATVELDRAEIEVAALVAAGTAREPSTTALPDDSLLGARARAVWLAENGPSIVLLEPSTEGRLAAALARFGEGPAVVYVGTSAGPPGLDADRLRGAGVAVSREEPGPFGPQVLVPGERPWGPHLIVTKSGYHRTMNDERLIALRPATDRDAAWMATLFSDEGYPAGPSDVASRLELFGGPMSGVTVAEIDGEPLGFIGFHVVARLESDAGFVRVVALVVDPGARDRGVGRLLMAEAERIGREAGAAFIEVTAGHHRPDAKRLYESLGYDASVTTYHRKRL